MGESNVLSTKDLRMGGGESFLQNIARWRKEQGQTSDWMFTHSCL